MPSPVSAAPPQPSAALEPVDDTCYRHGKPGLSGSISSTRCARDLVQPLGLFRLCIEAPSCFDHLGCTAAIDQMNLRAGRVIHLDHSVASCWAWAILLTGTKTDHRIQIVTCAS